MLQIIRFFKGYLSIKVWGFSPERFINLCGNHDIFLWDIINHGDYYTMCISLKGFYGLKSITRKTGTRVVVTARYGLPFLLMRIKKRKVFLAGLLGSFVFWIWMSGFIWSVDIEGNFYVTDDVFHDFLSEDGTRAGMKKKQVNIEELEKSIRNEFDIVTWTSAKIDGTRLIIQVKENDLIQNVEEDTDKEDEEEAYDIVAEQDGIVVNIITRSGIPRVSEGDEVKKGDILVEGCIPIYNEDTTIRRYEYCRADADITLQHDCSMTEELKETYEKKTYTGRKKKRKYIILGEKRISLPLMGKEYESFDRMESQKQLCVLGGYEFSVYFGQTVIREYTKTEETYTRQEVKEKFEEKIQKFIQTLEEKGVQITEKNVTIKKYRGTWKLDVNFTVMESAGEEKKAEIKPLENEQGV